MAKNASMWMEKESRRRRRETLQELANLSDSDSRRFMARVGSQFYLRSFGSTPPLHYRDDLRKIWSGDHETTERALNRWIQQAKEQDPWRAVPWSEHGRRYCSVVPNHDIFPLELALGVSELQPQMAVCENPKCPNRYFLKARKTQRFCDSPACAAYGQREHKRKWWSEHGSEWKQRRIKNRKVRGNKLPKKGESK